MEAVGKGGVEQVLLAPARPEVDVGADGKRLLHRGYGWAKLHSEGAVCTPRLRGQGALVLSTVPHGRSGEAVTRASSCRAACRVVGHARDHDRDRGVLLSLRLLRLRRWWGDRSGEV